MKKSWFLRRQLCPRSVQQASPGSQRPCRGKVKNETNYQSQSQSQLKKKVLSTSKNISYTSYNLLIINYNI